MPFLSPAFILPEHLATIGGKARNLHRLHRHEQLTIPRWLVLPATGDTASLLPDDWQAQLRDYFGQDAESRTYAVRSSALDEDGGAHSFAGQYETYLHVPFEEVGAHILKVRVAAAAPRVQAYRESLGLPTRSGIAVIVQEMIPAEVAGVAFGVHPVSGVRDTKVISAVYGLGEGLVSGELDADTFTVTPRSIVTQLAHKSHRLVRTRRLTSAMQDETPTGEPVQLQREELPEALRDAPTLTEPQIRQVADLLDELAQEFGGPQDVEFAFYQNQLYLLQSRPVTATGEAAQIDDTAEYTLWDNSNIIESYPGVTTPLTFSFIIKMYERVYRQFVELLGVKPREIEQHAEVFANTLGLVRGRVYYNLLSWYKMLAMVPGYSINAGFMETMMGVKERFELREDYQMSKGLAWWRTVQMLANMVRLHFRLPGERRRFMKHLEAVMDEYEAIDFDALSPSDIIDRYERYEQSLLLAWKAPLINDFFAMVWFGVLKKLTTRHRPDEPNLHNDLLCGSQDIISVEPIHRSIALARQVIADKGARALFEQHPPEVIWERLESGAYPDIKAAFDDYLLRFGNRCVGELKLETISYRQEPARFVKVIKAYVAQGVTESRAHNNIEEELRTTAERKMTEALRGKPLARRWFGYVLRQAREMVSQRENLRYERTRGFGMVRTIMNALGRQWHRAGQLGAPRDIFYLQLDEIRQLGDTLDPALLDRIRERKAEFKRYERQPTPQERFATRGQQFTDAAIYATDKLETLDGDLTGIGCCPGIVEARVRVVRDPGEVPSLEGDILVTSSTDPGWVTLFPTAAGIIVERGSLLSHSAIVSREMGIPCIVSVTGLLRTLRTGDLVRMDGSTGVVQVIGEL